MDMAINKVLITGNLTRDAELRCTRAQTPVLSFAVAVNDRRKNPQTGEWEDYPNFVDCAVFGTRAERLSRYLTKGLKVAVEGRLRYSTYMKNDEKRSKLSVIVDDVEFIGRREDADQPVPATAQETGAAPELYDEDIPF